jgi:thioredoxin-like negative regulator of GroEL
MDRGQAMLQLLVQGMYSLMANPDYATLLAQIAAESDATAKAALIAQCYIFTETLTTAEEELFDYVAKDYIDDTPGTTTSYIGIYYGDDGIIQ